ncbi:enoyl-CoA delta isomerase 1, peroxisomal isoform X1 [Brassica rapa]|uniref:enoyl-CoA delta isomerase 1, peroxisomal isoform X1 n=1 Tax=Brassica campestris TaxID=3711 RepID=UPI00142E0411|nr:enoyl-CoA delta isomerase 1, peroxisomal isoform X1 [Brassica rapa]
MCTLEKRGQLFLLKLTGDGEHRLNPTLLDSITSAITQIRSDPSSSQSVLITTSDGKFFSNGYDLALADSDPSLRPVMDSKLRSLVADLISLPMPTIAAVTGHASAAGFVLAMSHDYVLMRGDRGFLYMSELDIELVIPPWFAAMIRMKIGSPAARRDVMLKAEKVTAERGLEMGIVDSSYGSAAETVEGAVKLGEELVRRGVDGHVYGGMREALLKQVLHTIGSNESVSNRMRNSGSKLYVLKKQCYW